MNIIEAIKSGKPIRRGNRGAFFLHYESWYDGGLIPRDDLLADDWEIEQKPVTITRADFDAAWDRWFVGTAASRFYKDDLARELGL